MSDIPNFLLLGAARCGTTSLARYLRQHPHVFFSDPKEPPFFDAEYERGLAYYRRRYFAGWRGEPVVGEGRVANLFLPFVAPRIRESLPDARLVAILRDPVARAFSHWRVKRSLWIERLPFEDAVAENLVGLEAGPQFACPHGERRWLASLTPDRRSSRVRTYLDMGYYAEQIERYLALFPAARIKVVLLEDLSRDPVAVVRELWEFLGVDPHVAIAPAAPRNASLTPGLAPLQRLGRVLRSRGLLPAGMAGALHSALSRVGPRPAPASGTASWLAAHFAPHTHRLEALLGRSRSTGQDRSARSLCPSSPASRVVLDSEPTSRRRPFRRRRTRH